jgi:alkaline phosphatase D
MRNRDEDEAKARRQFLVLSGGVLAATFGARLLPRALEGHTDRLTDDPFQLGVASGDPLPDGIVLWTRLAPRPLEPHGGMPDKRVRVMWELAKDERFRRIVARGAVWTGREYAHSVHVDVRGLRPGHTYFYRFTAGDYRSPVGRTKTAPHPADRVGALAIAVASCQQWDAGYYTAYRHMAEQDVDLVLHLGDYIYEYGIDTELDADVEGRRDTRVPVSFDGDSDTLDRYRMQYGLYKSDPDLQAAHAAFPWLVTWDDHEVQDNYAARRASEDEEPTTVEDFLVRRAYAYRAYWEHMPLRPSQAPVGPDMRLYRRNGYGRLAQFHLLDTRQYRSNQACGDGFSSPDCTGRRDPTRTLLGERQESWLLDSLGRSPASWNVLAQSVVMHEQDRDASTVKALNMDAWDGYVTTRDRVFEGLLERKTRNPVALAGDIHSNWAADLRTNFDDPSSARVGVEFVGTSISSGGNGEPGAGIPPRGSDRVNPHVRFANFQRGYLRCTVTPDQWRTDFHVVPYVDRPGAPLETRASFVVEDGRRRLELA